MDLPYNSIFRKQNAELIPKGSGKAIIVAAHPIANTVDIYFVRNPETVITGVPVSDIFDLVNNSTFYIGRRCIVEIFDEVNSKDMVVVTTY